MGTRCGQLICAVCLLLTTVFSTVTAQIRWDGEAGDGLWTSPQNWLGNQVPAVGDRVILDNSAFPGSYEVRIGPGPISVSIASISIEPVAGEAISLVIPADNTLAPALVCTGNGYGLNIGAGATFRNASGASAGAPLEVTDSIRINNGGSFIHNTARSHANNVRSLSRAPGTESGVFEFRIPVASSTISISGQVFGRLRLMPGLNNSVNYTGTGTNDLTIRSDLEIGEGVNLNFNLEGQVIIGASLIQHGGVLNLGTTARQLDVLVGGDLRQSPGAVITETGQASPSLRMTGTLPAVADCKGVLTNNVTVGFDNTAGIRLESDLTISHILRLQRGSIYTNGYTLILEQGALLESADDSYVDGKIFKKGLTDGDFLFPVGKNGCVRWVRLREATGNFSVEFIRADPKLIAVDLGEGLSHISSLEHWQIASETPSAKAKVELSFHDVNSGGVTALDQLRVAYLVNNVWQDGGNITSTGSAGSAGSVTGNLVEIFSPGLPTFFTLASSSAAQNPLPLRWQLVTAASRGNAVMLKWEGESVVGTIYFPERSIDGRIFSSFGEVPFVEGTRHYSLVDGDPLPGKSYYRIREISPGGGSWQSDIVTIYRHEGVERKASVVVQGSEAKIFTAGTISGNVIVRVADMTGRLLVSRRLTASGDYMTIPLPVTLSKGTMLIFTIINEGGKPQTVRGILQ